MKKKDETEIFCSVMILIVCTDRYAYLHVLHVKKNQLISERYANLGLASGNYRKINEFSSLCVCMFTNENVFILHMCKSFFKSL